MIDKDIRILVVEDNMTDAVLLQRQLNKIFSNPEITISNTLENLLYTAKTFIPEIIFTDFNLGTFTGIEVMKEIKEIFPEIPIIIVTGALEEEEYLNNMILQSASGFFLKKNMNKLSSRMRPYIENILDDRSYELENLRKQQERVQKLERLHATLKEAANLDPEQTDPKMLDYYKQIIQDMNDDLDTILH